MYSNFEVKNTRDGNPLGPMTTEYGILILKADNIHWLPNYEQVRV